MKIEQMKLKMQDWSINKVQWSIIIASLGAMIIAIGFLGIVGIFLEHFLERGYSAETYWITFVVVTIVGMVIFAVGLSRAVSTKSKGETKLAWIKIMKADTMTQTLHVNKFLMIVILLAIGSVISLIMGLLYEEYIEFLLLLTIWLAVSAVLLALWKFTTSRKEEEKPSLDPVKEALKSYFADKQKVANLVLNIGTAVVIIVIFALHEILTNEIAFWLINVIFVLRIVVHLAVQVRRMRATEVEGAVRTPSTWGEVAQVILNFTLLALTCFFITALLLDMQLFQLLGLTDSGMGEIVYSINTILILFACVGVSNVIKEISTHKSTEFESIADKQDSMARLIMNASIQVIVPLFFVVVILPIFSTLNIEGVMVSGEITFEGQQTGTDWFAYVFYILFQRPLPAFMIAFMTVSAIGVIMAQNLGRIGSFMSATAIASIAIVPLIVVMSAITGSVAPPPELMEILGLDRAIASFIYGMGLVTSYIVVATILGTFIASAQLFGMEWT